MAVAVNRGEEPAAIEFEVPEAWRGATVRDLTGKGRGLTTLVQDPQLRWPDTFSEGPDGTIYVTTSHIQDSADYKPGAPISLPTELWAIRSGPGDVTGSTAPGTAR